MPIRLTYGTNNNEFGFDYLRDNMKFYASQLVQRGHNYAIVDEVGTPSLSTRARTPLIISGASEESVGFTARLTILSANLSRNITQLTKKARTAMLTDAGVDRCEELLGVENLFDPANITAQHHVLQALKAHKIFKRDIDYIVQDGQVVIVDEFTGRLAWPGAAIRTACTRLSKPRNTLKSQPKTRHWPRLPSRIISAFTTNWPA